MVSAEADSGTSAWAAKDIKPIQNRDAMSLDIKTSVLIPKGTTLFSAAQMRIEIPIGISILTDMGKVRRRPGILRDSPASRPKITC
ncbi:hypothetical protein D3C87_1547910 [compost metagenome]